MYVNVKCPNIYIKNKTFIRSYISVFVQTFEDSVGRNRNITPDNKCLILYIYVHIYEKYKNFFRRFLINKGNIHNPFHMKMNIVLFFPTRLNVPLILTAPAVTTYT